MILLKKMQIQTRPENQMKAGIERSSETDEHSAVKELFLRQFQFFFCHIFDDLPELNTNARGHGNGPLACLP